MLGACRVDLSGLDLEVWRGIGIGTRAVGQVDKSRESVAGEGDKAQGPQRGIIGDMAGRQNYYSILLKAGRNLAYSKEQQKV